MTSHRASQLPSARAGLAPGLRWACARTMTMLLHLPLLFTLPSHTLTLSQLLQQRAGPRARFSSAHPPSPQRSSLILLALLFSPFPCLCGCALCELLSVSTFYSFSSLVWRPSLFPTFASSVPSFARAHAAFPIVATLGQSTVLRGLLSQVGVFLCPRGEHILKAPAVISQYEPEYATWRWNNADAANG